MKQYSLFPAPPLFYGGDLIESKRKMQRPLSSKKALHLVLKAGKPVLYLHKAWIEKEIQRLGKKFQICVYKTAVNFDHVHFALRISSRKNYISFIRSLTGILARKLGKNLWKLLPFSRVVSWGRDFQKLLKYLEKNQKEAAGDVPYQPRRAWYKTHRARPRP